MLEEGRYLLLEVAMMMMGLSDGGGASISRDLVLVVAVLVEGEVWVAGVAPVLPKGG